MAIFWQFDEFGEKRIFLLIAQKKRWILLISFCFIKYFSNRRFTVYIASWSTAAAHQIFACIDQDGFGLSSNAERSAANAAIW